MQGIIEEDCQNGNYQLREGAELDTKNWDQPLITAEPEIQVTYFYTIANTYTLFNL